jgi:hypothetical protein
MAHTEKDGVKGRATRNSGAGGVWFLGLLHPLPFRDILARTPRLPESAPMAGVRRLPRTAASLVN